MTFRPHRIEDACHHLPKPCRRRRGLVAACLTCGALHVCRDVGYDAGSLWVWERLPDREVGG